MRVPVPVPVWLWRAMMSGVEPGERRRLNADPIATVDYRHDLPYGPHREQRLDVIAPLASGDRLPVYVYFHGGGWTSGDKATTTKYAATQALGGMVVVNANYRRATRANMHHILEDADAVLAWVRDRAPEFGGDPGSLVVGGDSAGGQIAALTTALSAAPDLANHYGIQPAVPHSAIKGLVQHCSMADFRLVFERGFVMGRDYVRMLLPNRGRGLDLAEAAAYLSPVEWVSAATPPTFVSSSARDFLLPASHRLLERLRHHRVPADALLLGRDARGARHTWQQDASLPESRLVYERLQRFVASVTGAGVPAITA